VTAAFDRYGIRQGERPTPNDLIASWRQLREEAKVVDIRFVRGLSRFIHYCSSRAIAPDQVDDSVMESFGAFLPARPCTGSLPRYRQMRCGIALSTIDAWPRCCKLSYRNCSAPLIAFR
jgi:hypothetical protein